MVTVGALRLRVQSSDRQLAGTSACFNFCHQGSHMHCALITSGCLPVVVYNMQLIKRRIQTSRGACTADLLRKTCVSSCSVFVAARDVKLLGRDVRSSILLQDGELARELHLTMPALRPQPAAMPARISTETERGPGHRSVCRSGILKSISRPSLWVFVGEQTENKESQLRALHPTCAMGHSR